MHISSMELYKSSWSSSSQLVDGVNLRKVEDFVTAGALNHGEPLS